MVNIKKIVASMDDMTRLYEGALDVLKAESGSESDIMKHMQCATRLLDGLLLFMSKTAVQHQNHAPFITEVMNIHAGKVQQALHATASTKEINAIKDVLAKVAKGSKETVKDGKITVMHLDASDVTSAEDLMKIIQENLKKITSTKH